jgi:hypothetical protein
LQEQDRDRQKGKKALEEGHGNIRHAQPDRACVQNAGRLAKRPAGRARRKSNNRRDLLTLCRLLPALENAMASRTAVIKWLLDSDPAIRRQVLRDLVHAPDDVVAAERARVVSEGWGARLLALQADGHWGGNDREEAWMPTIFTLVMLKDLGVDPSAEKVRNAIGLVGQRVTWWQLDGRPFFEGETEPCLNGRILGVGAYFGGASSRLLDRLLGEQLADGGWNCKAPPSTRSSFHTTICVLEGLLAYEQACGASAAVTEARRRGENYLVERRMLRRISSGEVIDRRWTRFAFPPTWHYDVLRGLDYLRSAGVRPDARLAEAVDVVKERAHQNGRWPQNVVHPDRIKRIPLDMESEAGKASRWNTLRALRVLDWYESGAGTA